MSTEGFRGLYFEDPAYNSWIAVTPKINGKFKVIIPERKSPMTISNIEDLFNWFCKVFPDSIEIVKVREANYD